MEKHTILIVDDVEFNRSWLSDMLISEYEIIEAENGIEAMSMLSNDQTEISLVLLDIIMPEMDGFEVLSIMNDNRMITTIPVITISSETSSKYIDKAYDLGATDYISRPFDEKTVLRRVKNTIMLYSKQKKMQRMIEEQIREKENNNHIMIEILSNIVEFRNGESGQHVLNIRILTELLLHRLVQHCNDYTLTNEEINLIVNASSLHDIGKISIPEEILNKPGKLTDEEFEIMKTHSAIGAQILEKAPYHQKEPLVHIAHDICRWHHERYDGNGYPDRLMGEEIPIAAQVVSLADVYDALTSNRVYKPAYSREKAMKMILSGECGKFNPLLIQCLKEIAPYIEEAIANDSGSETSFVRSGEQTQIDSLIPCGQASIRTLALLEQEREKYQFFASMSKELQFEYNKSSDILTLSELGANLMGLKELIVHPEGDPELKKVFSTQDYEDLKKRLLKTTPQNPIVTQTYRLHVGETDRWHKAIVRSLWMGEYPPKPTGYIGKFSDIHDEYMELRSLEVRAEQDSLTKLLNHTAAKKVISTVLGSEKNENYAMIIFDIDDFKQANDRFGHLFGDSVLKYVADTLMQNIRSNDLAVRVGGDEFMLFTAYKKEWKAIVNRIFRSLKNSYRGFEITVSMGISLFPEDGTEYDDLFYHADQALYAAKKEGKNQYRYYDRTLKESCSVLSPLDSESDAGQNSGVAESEKIYEDKQ